MQGLTQPSVLLLAAHTPIGGAGAVGVHPVEEPLPAPAVSIRSSVKKNHIDCLEDGKKVKMLKRHLMNAHSMTPAQYRTHWGLNPDYPMVASDNAETRRDLAKQSGLGRKPGWQ